MMGIYANLLILLIFIFLNFSLEYFIQKSRFFVI